MEGFFLFPKKVKVISAFAWFVIAFISNHSFASLDTRRIEK